MTERIDTATLDTFTKAYLECALWTTSECDEQGHELFHFDARFDFEDFSQESLKTIVEECKNFQITYAALLAQAGSDKQNGHDFWLTRNHHGAGFWDRGYRTKLADALTKAAHAEGSRDLYLGIDEKVHQA